MITNKKKVANNYNNEKGTNTKILTKDFERERKLKERESSGFGFSLVGAASGGNAHLFGGGKLWDLMRWRGVEIGGNLRRLGGR